MTKRFRLSLTKENISDFQNFKNLKFESCIFKTFDTQQTLKDECMKLSVSVNTDSLKLVLLSYYFLVQKVAPVIVHTKRSGGFPN